MAYGKIPFRSDKKILFEEFFYFFFLIGFIHYGNNLEKCKTKHVPQTMSSKVNSLQLFPAKLVVKLSWGAYTDLGHTFSHIGLHKQDKVWQALPVPISIILTLNKQILFGLQPLLNTS
jgi:hypothetical protein